MQDAIAEMLRVVPEFNDDLTTPEMDALVPLLDVLKHPLSRADIQALISMLPENGDTAMGLNWTILHAIEASPEWPLWDLLTAKDHEWIDIFRLRLRNGGHQPPEGF
ncbi:hypothetical protein QO010_004665 [Caulobacter ginsengisoli]|uniref:Uncharacterized protein n=1 Tax=Caulobacter ginsengisoli TaxID=400775 RepID=A0ABU0IXY0_9CAUL|nr:hypothetical protein [Caulobacter ginsengisoli]MDQ0466868.1 hypothetical protein [Caulobacter ginsengisoli]